MFHPERNAGTALNVAELRSAYFAGTCEDDALSGLPDAVSRSWRRLRDASLGPSQRFGRPTAEVSGNELDIPASMLRRIGPKLRIISGDPDASVCALFGSDGALSAFDGGEAAMRRLMEFGWTRKVVFTEEQAGTNAVDLAIRYREPHITFGAEHTCAALQDLSVYAFPMQSQAGALFGCMALLTPVVTSQPNARAVISLASILMEAMVEAESARSQLSRKFAEQRAMADVLKDGMMLINREGVIEYLNAPGGRILRVDPANAIGRRLADILGIEPVIAPIFRSGVGYSDEEVRLKKGDVDLHLIDTAIPIKDGGGNVLSVVNTFREFRRVAQVAQKFGGNQAHYSFEAIIGRSESLLRAIDMARRAAGGISNVLISGESGTGKELFAQGIHLASARAERPFVAVNCAALPRDLIESELFGYMPGSFTGANKTGRPGKFEIASGGTIFLDEISEMPLDVQAKLLRVLQEREVVRIGGSDPVAVDVRVIAAMNRNVRELVAQGRFREDLYYRINVIEIAVPALRDRPGDIRRLVDYYLHRYAGQLDKPVHGIADIVMRRLEAYGWPGNVRELQNTVERMVSLAEGSTVTDAMLPAEEDGPRTLRSAELAANVSSHKHAGIPTLSSVERDLLTRALIASEHNVTRAAEWLGLTKPRFYRLIDKHQIRLERRRA